QNGHTGDTLTIVGNYVGVPGSRILLDFKTQDGSADQVVINGNASGSTALSVLNLTPGAPFTTSPALVQFLHGTAAPGVFNLAIAQGFGGVDVVLLPQTNASAQNIALG